MSLAALAIAFAGLVVTLAWVGLSVAVAARLARRRPTVSIAVQALSLLALAGLWTMVALRAFRLTALFGLDSTLQTTVTVVAAVAAVGSLAILVQGWRRGHDGAERRGARWRLSLLLLALALGLGLGTTGTVILDRSRWAEIDRRLAENAARRAALVASPETGASQKTPQADEAYNRAHDLAGDARMRLQTAEDSLPPPPIERLSHLGPLTAEELAAIGPIVQGCAPTFEALARVHDFPSARFGFDPTKPDPIPSLPELARLRGLAGLSASAARVAAARQDRDATLAHLLVIDRIASHLVEQPTVSHLFVAVALRSMATETIASVAGQVDLRDERLFDPRFDREVAARMRAALAFERCNAESTLLGFVGGDGRALENAGFDPDLLPGSSQLMLRLVGLPSELAALDRGFAALDAAVADGTAFTDAPRTGLIAGLLVPALAKSIDVSRVRSQSAELRRAAIAIRTTPADAFDVSTLPRDPLGTGDERLILVRDGDRVTLYSRGANGLDDGGPNGARIGAAARGSDDVPILRMWGVEG
jgi:hypothetical protein